MIIDTLEHTGYARIRLAGLFHNLTITVCDGYSSVWIDDQARMTIPNNEWERLWLVASMCGVDWGTA